MLDLLNLFSNHIPRSRFAIPRVSLSRLAMTRSNFPSLLKSADDTNIMYELVEYVLG